MSHLYMLATGLLTQGPLLAGVSPEAPLLPPDPPNVRSNAKETEFFERIATHQTVPSLDFSTPEFSPELNRSLSEFSQITDWLTPAASISNLQSLNSDAVKSLDLKLSEVAFIRPELSPNSTEFSTSPHPASGTQLYQQRIAALEAGQIYTRLAADKFFSSWEKASEKPTYQQWKQLLEQEAKAIAQGQGVNRLAVLVGDSLTLWFPQERLPGRSLWLNQGISGDNSTGILKRLSAFSKTKPDTIYVLAGINDLRQGASDRLILSNIQQIIQRLRQEHPQANVIVQSILPTRLPTISNSRIRNLNKRIVSIVQQEGASYLDLHSRFTDPEGNMREDLTTDGLHLSQRGYAVWQSALSTQWSVASAKL